MASASLEAVARPVATARAGGKPAAEWAKMEHRSVIGVDRRP